MLLGLIEKKTGAGGKSSIWKHPRSLDDVQELEVAANSACSNSELILENLLVKLEFRKSGPDCRAKTHGTKEMGSTLAITN